MTNENFTKDELHKILLKEIDLIQDVIKRMAHNSFLIKGWTITLIVGTFLLKSNNIIIGCLISLIPLISFWTLDAFFLQAEKKYREMYNWVIKNRLNSKEFIYDLNPTRFDSSVKGLCCIALCGKKNTLRWFYGCILLTILVILGVSILPKIPEIIEVFKK